MSSKLLLPFKKNIVDKPPVGHVYKIMSHRDIYRFYTLCKSGYVMNTDLALIAATLKCYSVLNIEICPRIYARKYRYWRHDIWHTIKKPKIISGRIIGVGTGFIAIWVHEFLCGIEAISTRYIKILNKEEHRFVSESDYLNDINIFNKKRTIKIVKKSK